MKKLLFWALSLFCCFNAWCQSTSIDGILYELRDGVVYCKADNNLRATNIVIKSEVTINSKNYPVSRIDDDGFKSKNLLTLTIPEGVTHIGKRAFQNNKLTYVKLPESILEISSNAFFDNNLEAATIPDKVKTVRDGVFQNNKSINLITLGKEVNDISVQAFDSDIEPVVTFFCKAFVPTYKTIRDRFPKAKIFRFYNTESNIIPDSYFSNDEIIEDIEIDKPIIGKYAFANCKNLKKVKLYWETQIGANAFENDSLAVFVMPEKIKVGANAFKNCENMFKNKSNVATIDCENLYYGTFQNCGIQHLKLKGLKYCEKGVFDNNNILSVELTDSPVLEEKNALSFRFGKDVKIYALVNTQPTVQEIGSQAACSTNVNTISLTGLFTIGSEAFKSCKNLEKLTCDKVTSIGDEAFAYCESLETVYLGDSTKSFGDRAFYHCSRLNDFRITYKKDDFQKGVLSDDCWCSLETLVDYTDQLKMSIKSINSIILTNSPQRAEKYKKEGYPYTFSLHRMESPADVNGDGTLSGADAQAVYNSMK